MKNLSKKLFATAVVLSLIEAITIFVVGYYEIVLPKWGIYLMGAAGALALISLLLFIIRQATGADEFDGI